MFHKNKLHLHRSISLQEFIVLAQYDYEHFIFGRPAAETQQQCLAVLSVNVHVRQQPEVRWGTRSRLSRSVTFGTMLNQASRTNYIDAASQQHQCPKAHLLACNSGYYSSCVVFRTLWNLMHDYQ